MSNKTDFPYLHGFSQKEQDRLRTQAAFAEHTVYQDINLSSVKNLLEVGCGVGAQMDGYCAQPYTAKATKAKRMTNTISFHHHHITQPELTAEDRLLHGIQVLTLAVTDTPKNTPDSQLEAIERLCSVLKQWVAVNGSLVGSPPLQRPPQRMLQRFCTRHTDSIPVLPP